MKANVWLVMQKRLSLKDYDYVVGEIDKELSKVRKQTLEEVLKRLLKIPTKDWEIDRDYIVKEIKWLEQKLKEAGKST